MLDLPANPRTVARTARAKVNLALAVGPPRDGDGMHLIASWMAPVSLADELLVTRLPDDRLSRYAILWHAEALRPSPIDWSITRDLAVRAHHLLECEAARSLPVQLRLDKRIPVGGGLGGGSADAAAMMLAVRELFELDISDARLVELARELGSDVAFFLSDGPAIVEGVGDRVERTPPVAADLVLVAPDFGCPTGPVYKAFDSAAPRPLRDAEVRAMALAGAVDPMLLFNDLTDPAIEVEPRLAVVMEQVRDIAARPVHMSGSGSTLFVVAASREDAEDLAEDLVESIGDIAARAVTPT